MRCPRSGAQSRVEMPVSGLPDFFARRMVGSVVVIDSRLVER
jgi:hypothetical protein